MLAGLIRGPSVYNPLLDWNAAKNRQRDVLQAMVRDQKITALQAAQAFVEDISAPKHMYTPINTILAPAFVRYVTGQLVATYGADATYTGGLHVTTTLNWKLQSLAQKSVTNTVKSLAYRRVSQGALVSIDPTHRRHRRDGRLRQPEGQRRPVQPCCVASPQPWLVNEDLHLHDGDRQRQVHDDHADRR